MEKPASHIQGFLLFDYNKGKHIFRVYETDKTYKDYVLAAEDIKVEILSTHLSLKETNNGNYLDYSGKYLGRGLGEKTEF